LQVVSRGSRQSPWVVAAVVAEVPCFGHHAGGLLRDGGEASGGVVAIALTRKLVAARGVDDALQSVCLFAGGHGGIIGEIRAKSSGGKQGVGAVQVGQVAVAEGAEGIAVGGGATEGIPCAGLGPGDEGGLISQSKEY
jgi:hypothetical protein